MDHDKLMNKKYALFHEHYKEDIKAGELSWGELSPETKFSVCEGCGKIVDSEMPFDEGEAILCDGNVCENPIKKAYTLAMVYNNNMTDVLMLYRKKDPYEGRLNGLGGKLEDGEEPVNGIIRELYEEANIRMEDILDVDGIMTLTFHSDRTYNIPVDMHVFTVVLQPTAAPLIGDTPEGKLSWYKVDYIMKQLSFHFLAGEGNIPFFIQYALSKAGKIQY